MKITPSHKNEGWGLRYQQMNAHPNENLIGKIKNQLIKNCNTQKGKCHLPTPHDGGLVVLLVTGY